MEAIEAGVEVLAYGVKITPNEMLFGQPVLFSSHVQAAAVEP
jgi:DNA-binding sugar fermentation-stimulating protein